MCQVPYVDLMSPLQIGTEGEDTRKLIAELKADIEAAVKRQKEAEADVKKLERDMNDFKNNKEGKIEELKVRIHHTVCYTGV